MNPDLDDTVTWRPRRAFDAQGGDLDDTVVTAPRQLPLEFAPPADPARPAAQHDTAPMPVPLVDGPLGPRYGFRIGETGRAVLLDAAVLVGRSPSSPRIQHGRLPQLVKVSSPRNEVSGTHLEIRQVGATVVVTDLKSTNGSTVAPPGGTPRALRQGESMVVMPGTLVDIGDGNVIEILPVQRRLGEDNA